MCWVLYLASEVPLRTIDWNQEKPAFTVQAIPRAESPVSRQFAKQHIYIVGSHTLCGCGFDRAQANLQHPDELMDAERSLGALQAYLREAVGIAGELELYACWDGDQAVVPDHRWAINPDDVSPTMSWFPDRTYATISGQDVTRARS
jgi:hypothetical protein